MAFHRDVGFTEGNILLQGLTVEISKGKGTNIKGVGELVSEDMSRVAKNPIYSDP